MTIKLNHSDQKDDIEKIYKLFTDEKTGKINIKSLKKVSKELGEQIDDNELQEMIEKADTDGDG